MRQSVRLGRIAGIQIGANWGVLIIVALVTFGLAGARFPSTYPGRPAVAYWIAAAVTVVLFLLSLLAHELAHALVAKANGVRVERITLWLFGGVAELSGQLRRPGADFAVAVVGPATSVVLAVGFGAAAVGLDAAGVDGLVVSAAGYLAVVNLMLAVFNLLPAAPLDGGRVLRAAVWRVTGDRVRAAVLAARAGRFLGYALIVLGLGLTLYSGALSGLWWALIGWFLVTAANAEEQYANLDRRLGGVRVGAIMARDPITAPADATLSGFIASVAMRYPFSTYPIVDASGRLSGLVTLNRIRAVPPERRDTTRLVDVACPPDEVPTALSDEPLVDLLPRMAGCTDGRAVVVDGSGRVVGVVTASDIARTVALADLNAATGGPGPRQRSDGPGIPAPTGRR
jgi:Zn-dependent protease/CBS domain-containing protein